MEIDFKPGWLCVLYASHRGLDKHLSDLSLWADCHSVGRKLGNIWRSFAGRTLEQNPNDFVPRAVRVYPVPFGFRKAALGLRRWHLWTGPRLAGMHTVRPRDDARAKGSALRLSLARIPGTSSQHPCPPPRHACVEAAVGAFEATITGRLMRCTPPTPPKSPPTHLRHPCCSVVAILRVGRGRHAESWRRGRERVGLGRGCSRRCVTAHRADVCRWCHRCQAGEVPLPRVGRTVPCSVRKAQWVRLTIPAVTRAAPPPRLCYRALPRPAAPRRTARQSVAAVVGPHGGGCGGAGAPGSPPCGQGPPPPPLWRR